MTYAQALRAANNALYVAIRAAGDRPDRPRLGAMARELDAMVDKLAPSVAETRAHQMNAELPEAERAVLQAKGMI